VAVNGQAVVRFGTPSTTLGVTSVPIIFDSIPTPLSTFYLKGNYNNLIYDFASSMQSDSLTMAGGLGIVNIVCQLGNIEIAWANPFHPTVLNDTVFILKFSNTLNDCDDFIWDTITPGSQCGLSNTTLIPTTFVSYLCNTTASDDESQLKGNSLVNITANNNTVFIESQVEGKAYLIDIAGRVLLDQPIEIGRSTFYINKPGVYFVNVRSSTSIVRSIKLMVL